MKWQCGRKTAGLKNYLMPLKDANTQATKTKTASQALPSQINKKTEFYDIQYISSYTNNNLKTMNK